MSAVAEPNPFEAAVREACRIEFEIEGLGELTDERWEQMVTAWRQPRIERLARQVRAAVPAYLRAEAEHHVLVGVEDGCRYEGRDFNLLSRMASQVGLWSVGSP